MTLWQPKEEYPAAFGVFLQERDEGSRHNTTMTTIFSEVAWISPCFILTGYCELSCFLPWVSP